MIESNIEQMLKETKTLHESFSSFAIVNHHRIHTLERHIGQLWISIIFLALLNLIFIFTA